MSFDISVAGIPGIPIPTDPSFFRSFRDDLDLAFGLDKALSAFLDGPLSGVPANACTSQIAYTSPAIPLLGTASPVNFSLSGSVKGAFEIVLSGDLLSFTDGLEDPKLTSIVVPPHTAYTRVTLNFSISVNASGSYSGGPYGVKGSGSSDDTYAVTFCKAFDPATPVKTAIARTIQGFVLPLTAETIELLESRDYLLHEFDGKLNLSFGAFAGIDKVLYAGQSKVDVLSAKTSPIATLSTAAKPEIKFDAELDFTFEYSTRFEALVSKIGDTGTLHLFRSRKASTTTSIMTGLSFNANASAKIDTSLNSLASSFEGGSKAITAAVNVAKGEIEKGVTDVNNRLSRWLGRLNGKANLQLAIETIAGRTILAAYDFALADASNVGLRDAWKLAIDGDFVRLLQFKDATTGKNFVTLEIGSGLESEFQRKSSLSCNFFNLWHYTTWDQWKSEVSMVYAGNNVFHMMANVGRLTETDYVGAMKSIDFYFTASANELEGAISGFPAVDLHIDLTAQASLSAARQIAAMLKAIGTCATCGTMSDRMNAFIDASPRGTVQLNITIPSTAYRRIVADPVSSNAIDDRKNWNYYVAAADGLRAWPLFKLTGVEDPQLKFIKTYEGWEDFSRAVNDRPNRKADIKETPWPQDLLAIIDPNLRNTIVYSVRSGQCFMNLCEALQQLANVVDTTSAGTTWKALVDLITGAVNDYVPDFARPVALALIWLCGSGVTELSGPSDDNASSGKFQVKLIMRASSGDKTL